MVKSNSRKPHSKTSSHKPHKETKEDIEFNKNLAKIVVTFSKFPNYWIRSNYKYISIHHR
jgi:hypothetical protein